MGGDPFVFKASATLARYSGYFADSARTLQTAIEGAPASSIYYHLHHSLFRKHFTTSEFLNDFATWAWATLGDEPLAELLAAVDPLDLVSIEQSREALVRIIGEYVGRMEYTPSVGFKQRFCFQSSVTFIHPIGKTADNVQSFVAAARKRPRRASSTTSWLRRCSRRSATTTSRSGYAPRAATRRPRCVWLSPYATDLYGLGKRVAEVLE